MRQTAVLVALLVALGAAPAFALHAELDTFIDNRTKSDIHPVADAGEVLGYANKGVDKTYHFITDPMKPVLDPIRKVRDESLRYSKLVLNKTWDFLTLRHLRKSE
jgi:hypothetical protein